MEPRPTAPVSDHTPLVSVIMPAYNAVRYIQEAIDSVLAQDYPAKELIIIDDGSTDGTVEAVRAYGDRVTLLRQRNDGSAAARNAGLDAAKCEYVAFLDADDIWLPGKLALQVEYLERHAQIGMVYARWHVWRPNRDGAFPPAEAVSHAPDAAQSDQAPALVPEGSGWLYNRLLFTSLLHTITVVARRQLIDTVGRFDVDLKRGQDYDYWLRASRHTQIHQLDRVLALYRVHGDGSMKKWPEENYELIVIEKALQRWGREGPAGEMTPEADIHRRLADICFGFGYHHYWHGSRRLALRAFREALRRRPGHLSSWRYFAMSLVGRLRHASRSVAS